MISQADNPKDQQTNGYNMEYKVAPYSNIKKKKNCFKEVIIKYNRFELREIYHNKATTILNNVE